MKFKMLVMAIAATASYSNAAVTITPMLGYHSMDAARSEQRDVLTTTVNGQERRNALDSDIHEAYAAGIELTQRISAELEYGQTQTMAARANRSDEYDARQQNYNLNFLVDNDWLGVSNHRFKTYALAGGGHTNIELKDHTVHSIPGARKVNASTDDTLANLGYGFRYHFNRAVALRGEGRLAYNIDNKWLEPMALIGLQLRLGRLHAQDVPVKYVPPVIPEPIVAPPPAAPVDSDRDGVYDPQDQCPDTPTNLKVDRNGCPMESVEEITIPLKVLFDTNKWDIRPAYYDEIAKVATFMRENPNATATIEGHTDNRGSRELNTKLSENRAEAVRQVLVSRYQIDSSRLSAAGYGPDRPIAGNDTAEGRQLNRRTVAVVKGSITRKVTRN